MDEKRRFFRLKNDGNIKAIFDGTRLEVIEISSTGMAIIKENTKVSNSGLLDLIIRGNKVTVRFELLRVENDTMVLLFPYTVDVENLFAILREIKNHPKA